MHIVFTVLIVILMIFMAEDRTELVLGSLLWAAIAVGLYYFLVMFR